MMTCKQLIEDFLADYLEATLSPALVAELEQHVAACAPCMSYLNTYKKTRELVRREAASDMPAEMKAVLRKFMLDQMAKDKS